jgi:hypothetical protein
MRKKNYHTGNKEKAEEMRALCRAVAELWKQMNKVKEGLEQFGGCPLEIASEMDELAKQTKGLFESCILCYDSLLEGRFVPKGNITGLRRRYEGLKRMWSKFLENNRLGIIYI